MYFYKRNHSTLLHSTTVKSKVRWRPRHVTSVNWPRSCTVNQMQQILADVGSLLRYMDYWFCQTKLILNTGLCGRRTKSNQRWMKLRTTVQLSGAITTIQKKPPLKREDSFLKRFSTRQIPETQVSSYHHHLCIIVLLSFCCHDIHVSVRMLVNQSTYTYYHDISYEYYTGFHNQINARNYFYIVTKYPYICFSLPQTIIRGLQTTLITHPYV